MVWEVVGIRGFQKSSEFKSGRRVGASLFVLHGARGRGRGREREVGGRGESFQSAPIPISIRGLKSNLSSLIWIRSDGLGRYAYN